ncbi:fibronectin type-III domain-containing transmembrane protein C1orf233-like [Labeo rohita]|uniref:Fibronectin type-III domain-containing transmembrane protein C1orf233-like n=1 Tax=Labeo rohita TaxID=84645 RepID=A0A498L4H9_LABRO|nr:fibronectin type III domain-containing protein 10 [Labeo rohita]RXN03139.1 fibronectin type-III domain-containing transmembrane protein C1orf233-like [Labeo rohita]
MARHQGSVLLRCAVLLVLSSGSSALPNRTSSVRDAQYETTDSNNTNKYTNKDSLEWIPKLQGNSTVKRWRVLGEVGPLCAYRTLGAGDPGPLCFRYAQPDFRCASASCRQVSSPGGQLTANILSNGSVFIQWTVGHEALPTGLTPVQTGGFRLSCWWNGSYTQFECAGVHLGSSCRDYLLNELHANVPYRLCVRPYALERAQACVEFSLAPGGMQDIVIAMTTVGGAICVMLVIICLLVAYITENIMNPTAQHTLTAQHSHRSHLHTHL